MPTPCPARLRTHATHRRWARLVAAPLLAATLLAACGGKDDEGEPLIRSFAIQPLGLYEGGAVGAAEITAYDAASKRLFVVNGAAGNVDVLDLSNPASPRSVGRIDITGLGAAANSVAVHDGLVAVAIEAAPKTAPGAVAFYNAADLRLLSSVTVGAQPDMVSFTPDGLRVLAALEGEPNSYGLPDSVDPEGGVAIITVNRGGTPTLVTADFRAWNGREAELRAQGVRIFGPGASAAQDLEPEYVTISDDSRTAWVTLQENNAVATVDIAAGRVTAIRSLGWKDHSRAGAGLDASDEDGGTNTNTGTPAIRIVSRPVRGLYLPDAIASYTVDGTTYLVTANEGDARADWPGFNEETRVRAHCPLGLDPTVFADATNLLFDSALGRLRVTTSPDGANTGKNAAGQCTELYAFGARSFTIWDTSLRQIWDSGDDLEQRTQASTAALFNASHDNNTLDSRSPSKGPEPEGVVIGRFGTRQIAFIGLERIGGVMAYDITNPRAPVFLTHYNARSALTGPRGPEGLLLITADKSPNGKPLLVIGNEVSGTTQVLQIEIGY